MNIVAVTISKDSLDWPIRSIPHFIHREPIQTTRNHPFHYTSEMARIRNNAVEEALKLHPETDHVLVCDSYYVEQPAALRQLVADYNGGCILGGALWALNRVVFPQVFKCQIEWCDTWAVPDCTGFRYSLDTDRFKTVKHRTGLFKVGSVGGVFLFPRRIWERGTRFGSYPDLHGCEFNYFCEHTGLAKMVDFDAAFFRETVYPVLKCFRVSLHLGRLRFWRKWNTVS